MGLLKLSQEAYSGILNYVLIGSYDWTQLNVAESSLWSLKQLKSGLGVPDCGIRIKI